MIDFIQVLTEFGTNIGLDAIIIFAIIIITLFLRKTFQPQSKMVPLLAMIISLVLGIGYVLVFEIPFAESYKIVIGYFCTAIATYMLSERYFVKTVEKIKKKINSKSKNK